MDFVEQMKCIMKKKKSASVKRGLTNLKKSASYALKIKYLIKRLENVIVKKTNILLKLEVVSNALRNQFMPTGNVLAYLTIIRAHQGLAGNARKRLTIQIVMWILMRLTRQKV